MTEITCVGRVYKPSPRKDFLNFSELSGYVISGELYIIKEGRKISAYTSIIV